MASNIEINKKLDGSKLTVSVSGRIDTTTAPLLETELKTSLNDVTDLVFDLEGLEYISSAGLRVLLSAQKVMNKQGTMVIHNANEEVYDVFDVTGFVDILTIE
ncbi:MAG: STAS domain-containing protein [Lachnospiraceae bacterium]|nr:STAS domain-containing protein [Lachnospiraceae bacterium]